MITPWRRVSSPRSSASGSSGGPSGRRARPAARCLHSSRAGTILIGGIRASATSHLSASRPGRGRRRREGPPVGKRDARRAGASVRAAARGSLRSPRAALASHTLTCPPKRGSPKVGLPRCGGQSTVVVPRPRSPPAIPRPHPLPAGLRSHALPRPLRAAHGRAGGGRPGRLRLRRRPWPRRLRAGGIRLGEPGGVHHLDPSPGPGAGGGVLRGRS